MAQAQILGPQRNSGHTQDFPHQFPLLQPGSQHTPHSFGFSQRQLQQFALSQMMAQPMHAAMQRRFGTAEPQRFQQPQQQPHQQQLRPSPKSTLSMNDGAAEGYTTAMEHYLGGPTGFDQSQAWSAAQMMGPDSNNPFHQNNNLMYNPVALQHATPQHHSSYGGPLSWTASAMRGGIAGTGTSIPDFESLNSHSPKSYLSDVAEASFSPRSLPGQSSPQGGWSGSSPSLPTKTSSPQFPQSFPQLSLAPAPSNSFRRPVSASGSGGGHSGPAIMPSTSEAGQFAIASSNFIHDGHQPSPDGSLTSAGSSKLSWYTPGGVSSQAGVSPMQQNAMAYGTNSEGNTSATSASNSPFSSYPSPSGSSPNSSVDRSRSNYKARFQAPPTDTQGQRKYNDELLIKGKQDGMTYRDIRKKMLGEKPAESTLRGRYRALTKARKDRVRKPVWHRRDIDLLNSFVGNELKRIQKTFSNPNGANIEQKLIKVRWKEVAEYIAENGGSYHFGNSTCKRKWKELNGHAE